ncbi:hypothetical protein M231_03223 [Tremella mesenterica]|uniref:Uncharacterized protein n=1 Tax=Tremella mesenterica TaxID=5217 RepID=A0A4Q1BNU6_TREME|nr:uncharacterized protein TREMEDRAFT_62365 [Tremella mesenterica DSM 1558]EIW69505.1 hypothetical protein TREMEDRAFT_62365 [Tremella mesenterica DSM 1558]RXK39554.1 hypothetical protein M231_03223 [Tremella mesenterica]
MYQSPRIAPLPPSPSTIRTTSSTISSTGSIRNLPPSHPFATHYIPCINQSRHISSQNQSQYNPSLYNQTNDSSSSFESESTHFHNNVSPTSSLSKPLSPRSFSTSNHFYHPIPVHSALPNRIHNSPYSDRSMNSRISSESNYSTQQRTQNHRFVEDEGRVGVRKEYQHQSYPSYHKPSLHSSKSMILSKFDLPASIPELGFLDGRQQGRMMMDVEYISGKKMNLKFPFIKRWFGEGEKKEKKEVKGRRLRKEKVMSFEEEFLREGMI